MSDTTFVLTSCGRFDLLAETMLTFLSCNPAPIARYLVVEDSGNAGVRDVLGGLGIPIDILVNDPPVGQMASIDRAYALVDTPYESASCETTGSLRHVETATSPRWRWAHGIEVVVPDAMTRE